MSIVVRPATRADVPEILELIHLLAEYEREPDAVRTTVEVLEHQLFGDAPAVFALVAEAPASTAGGPRLDGVAVWFLSYSTWEGTHGIHLEDLVVREEARGRGVGSALLARLARTAQERGYARVEWSVLRWNEPAIGFYRRLGAQAQQEWETYRLSGDALARMVGRD